MPQNTFLLDNSMIKNITWELRKDIDVKNK